MGAEGRGGWGGGGGEGFRFFGPFLRMLTVVGPVEACSQLGRLSTWPCASPEPSALNPKTSQKSP